MSFADTAQNLLANENQVPDLHNYNLFDTDLALQDAVKHFGVTDQHDLISWGSRLGTEEMFRLGATANTHGPELHSFDRRGKRIDVVDFHPAWYKFLSLAFAQNMHGNAAWLEQAPAAHVKRAVHYLMHGQVEAGSLCPITMTSAAIPLLMQEPWFDDIRTHLASNEYDFSDQPLAQKKSMMIGMGMTEKQGGSDLRSNVTQADPIGSGWFRLRGHKWFFSSPMSDAHLMLARDADSYSCFYVPRWLDDGTRNKIYIKRLKDKLGNKSNSSAEIEFSNALGRRIGIPGKGIATIIKMASNTRMDCVLGSAALMRQALVQAIHHTSFRRAFGNLLIKQPLMRNILADMALETEAATMLAIRLANAFDNAANPAESFFKRIITPAAKYWICKRTIKVTAESMEVWGGNGYIEDGPMAILYREAPVNSIWEGSGNVMCLDVLRAVIKQPDLAFGLLNGLVLDHKDQPKIQQKTKKLLEMLQYDADKQQIHARSIARDLVLLVQADLLLKYSPDFMAQAFIQTRLSDCGHDVFGGQAINNTGQILRRSWPV